MTVSQTPAPLHGTPVPSTSMARVLLVTYGSRTEADVAVAHLRSEGIDAVAVTDSAGGFEPQLDLIRGVRVLVHEEDRGDARDVLGLAGGEADEEFSVPRPAAWARPVAAWLLGLIVVGGLINAMLELFGS